MRSLHIREQNDNETHAAGLQPLDLTHQSSGGANALVHPYPHLLPLQRGCHPKTTLNRDGHWRRGGLEIGGSRIYDRDD